MALLRPFAIALTFLTRFPIAIGAIKPKELGRAVAFFPLVGLLLGLLLVAVQWGVGTHLSPHLTALLLVAISALVTGGLHLDGVADLFDALGGGRGDRQRMLRIMRDPQIGAHGATALMLVLLGKVLATSEVLQAQALWPVLAAPITARAAVVPLIAFLPYARPEGLGREMSVYAGLTEVSLALLFLLVALGMLGVFTLAPALIAMAIAVVLGAWMRHRLGGLTGDVYGAAIELAELGFLVASGLGAGANG